MNTTAEYRIYLNRIAYTYIAADGKPRSAYVAINSKDPKERLVAKECDVTPPVGCSKQVVTSPSTEDLSSLIIATPRLATDENRPGEGNEKDKNHRDYIIEDYYPGQPLQKYLNEAPFFLNERIAFALALISSIDKTYNNSPQRFLYGLNAKKIIVNLSEKESPLTIKSSRHTITINNPSPDTAKGKQKLADEAFPQADVFFYQPPEFFSGEAGVKSNTHSITPILLMLLGVKDPYIEKNKLLDEKKPFNEVCNQAAYSNSGLLDPANNKEYVRVLRTDTLSTIKSLLTRAQNIDYDKRPDCKELYLFFSTLQNLYNLYKKNYRTTNRFIHLAQLALIANGLWNDEISALFNERPERTPLFRAITCLEKTTLLSDPWVKKITKKDRASRQYIEMIIDLGAQKCLTAETIALFTDKDEHEVDLWHNIIIQLFNTIQKKQRWLNADIIADLKRLELPSLKTVEKAIKFCHSPALVHQIATKPVILETLQKHSNLSYGKVNAACLSACKDDAAKTAFIDQLSVEGWREMRPFLKEEKLLELVTDKINVADFIGAYKRTYNATFFKNPWSKMRQKIKNRKINTYKDIETHATSNPSSRTCKVLKKLERSREKLRYPTTKRDSLKSTSYSPRLGNC